MLRYDKTIILFLFLQFYIYDHEMPCDVSGKKLVLQQFYQVGPYINQERLDVGNESNSRAG